MVFIPSVTTRTDYSVILRARAGVYILLTASRQSSCFFSSYVLYNCTAVELVFFVLGAIKLVFYKGEEEVFFLWFFRVGERGEKYFCM